jgi:hypothetical protein
MRPSADILKELESELAKPQDTDFGAFGIISRMNTNFHLLKDFFNSPRKRKVSDQIRTALKQIAVDAVTAQTIL